jgi:type I restriction enzyme S subunit
MLAPKLRFREFEGEWTSSKIGDIAIVTSGGTPSRSIPEYWNGVIPWITTSLVDFNIISEAEEFITEKGVDNSSAKLFPENTILMAMYGQGVTRGKVAILGIAATTNQACAAIKLKSYFDTMFVFQNLMNRYEEIRDLSNDGGQKNLSAGIIKDVPIFYPLEQEQTKIATFLSAVDDKISQLIKKHQLLSQYKQGMMQKLFSQQLRFKADDDEEFEGWREKAIGDLFLEIKDKVLSQDIENFSITAGRGFVSQAEKFGRDISGSQNSSYIVLKPNDFSYNKGNSKTFKYGCVYLNEFKFPIAVPNVFISFRVKSTINVSNKFYALLFESHYLDSHLRLLISSSARMDGLLNVSKEGFFGIILPLPCLAEQTKIANFLSAIDHKIAVAAQQIEQAKQWKKGLLQQMFV